MGITQLPSETELTRLRDQYRERSYTVMAELLDPELLQLLRGFLETANFSHRTHEGIGEELCLSSGRVPVALELLINDQGFLEVIQQVTGEATLGCFEGRVYRMVPGAGHYDSWHSDAIEDRVVAMSINLGEQPFEGGVLQIRDTAGRWMQEVANRGPGDALIFKVDSNLRHRVSAVSGRVAKTAYAGWFRMHPRYSDLLKKRLKGWRGSA